ncbi:hypothetical protein [Streptomyces sp. YIM S03343]
MPDRSLRLLPLPPQTPSLGGRRGPALRGRALLRERPASPPDAPPTGGGSGAGGDSGNGDGRKDADDNPFAPPPEGTPDRPWQPRRPAKGGHGKDDDSSDSHGGSDGGGYTPWGSQWSDRQPGRSAGGGFGERPGSPSGKGGPEGQGGPSGPGMRWDPTDPVQRRARYSLLGGMWAFFFILFGWPYMALLLGALALYWGISSLRGKPRRATDPNTPPPPDTGRSQTTAAISGLVTATLALSLVAATFTAQLVYRDYYTCTSDALTHQAKQSCTHLLPKELRGLLGNNA